MKNEVILTGKTVEEAMAQARAQYGSPENELSFEILEMPKKGFLGIGAAPAKIKVTITKALEEVNLSDLVSDLRSMKITTDRDGSDTPAQKPQESRQKKNSRESQPSGQKNPNHAQNEQKKPQEAKEKSQNQPKQPNPQKPQNQNAQNPQKKAEQKPQQPKAEAKPENKPQQPKPAKEAAAPKAEVKEIRTEAAAVKTEKTAELDESNLPAALRRPVQKNNPQPKKQQPKKQPRPQDNRDGETKKKDLLSAVMGVADAPKKADSPAVTVIPTVMKPAAPAEEPKSDISAAVDAALAAIEAETPAPLEFEEETPAPVPEKEEARVEYITPAEMELALQFVNTLLSDMNLEARAQIGEPKETDNAPEGLIPARVEIVGDDTGILIGHHGETLDAIQYLMNLSTSRRSGSGKREFVKILLDVGNYREKREETLRALARRTAARVVKYKRNIVLEPMNPYERRIIHSEIHNIPDVSTHSVGSDENRKIVITYEGADKPKDSGKNRRDRSRRRSDKSDRGEKAGRSEKSEKTEKTEKTEKSEKPRRDRPNKPVRAKSIDDVLIDISEESGKTFGSINADEGVETSDPIAEIAREAEAGEENLREY